MTMQSVRLLLNCSIRRHFALTTSVR